MPALRPVCRTVPHWRVGHGTGNALTKAGGDTWFFITADYAFGYALERDTVAAVQAAGGKVLGSVKAPLGTADFSSYLVQAKASGAKVMGFANAGTDLQNCIKQAAEFGLSQGGTRMPSSSSGMPMMLAPTRLNRVIAPA